MKSFASPRLYKAASLLVALSLVMPSYAGGNGFNPENNLRSSNNNTDIGVNISANALYALGYTGTRSIIANIEGGRTWDGHDVFHASATQFKTITDISDYANNPGVAAEAGWGGSLGDLDRHATWVGHSMAGFDPNNASPLNTRRGIAYGAELWSGGVATEFGPHAAGSYGGSFNWSTDKVFINPYLNALVNGVGGRKADIVNSSWGFTEPTGYNSTTIAGDAVAWQSKKIMVFSAGNSGQNSNGTDRPNSVGGIGAGHNTITVGALGSDTSASKFGHRSSFSSHGANDYDGPDGFHAGVRARVDISAPGQNLSLAAYLGGTGGAWGNGPDARANLYFSNVAGTSFSSPITAASAALLVDAAKDKGYTNAPDGRVMKALLLNGADKPAAWAGDGQDTIPVGAWNNGQHNVGGVIFTDQALDYNYGAGALNVKTSYDNMTLGTTDVAGLGSGNAQAIGWDFAEVSRGSFNRTFLPFLDAGSTFTATLNWFTHDSIQGFDNNPGGYTNATFQNILDRRDKFAKLKLGVYHASNNALVAESFAEYITTQHLQFAIPTLDRYYLKVSYVGDRYNFDNTSTEQYGLAWRGTASAVPEPASLIALAAGIAAFARKRRKSA